ncbi:MAG: VWA domain-containing protein [Schleiferiaceae bacterium]|nr:VWA domain-containing protein [Schleiferiaceae bacterium]
MAFRFSTYLPPHQTPFEKLFDIFKELITHTSGDVDEAIDWLRELDKAYDLTDENYTIDDFVNDLLEKRYLQEGLMPNPEGGEGAGLSITAKTERAIKSFALEQIFGKLKKTGSGNHRTNKGGTGGEDTNELRQYQYGDAPNQIAMLESLKNAQINHGVDNFFLTESDLLVKEQYHQAQLATVLMIDISHSMILYGEDRITPAKKVAMALSELIARKYPKDSLEVVVFGNDAWQISIGEIPYLKVGPYHTNTVAGLQLAMDLLRRKKHSNKQIFMITDGKPSCLVESDGTYYKNSFGLDPYIVGKCVNMAAQARKLNIPITTFMIAEDPYLQQFVQQFSEANNGKAFYTGLKGLGDFIFQDYESNRRRNIR